VYRSRCAHDRLPAVGVRGFQERESTQPDCRWSDSRRRHFGTEDSATDGRRDDLRRSTASHTDAGKLVEQWHGVDKYFNNGFHSF